MNIISIPEPCHEDWNKMKAEERGRFCGSCCKVVVDFTTMQTDEIVQFIQSQGEKKVCGHFRSEQVDSPPVFVQNATENKSYVMRFLAALVLVFGSALFVGCHSNKHDQGQIRGRVSMHDQPFANVDSPAVDSIELKRGEVEIIQGKTMVVDTAKRKPYQPKMGKVQINPK
jgi:hypothetical protein